MSKLKIKKGDNVIITTGRKEIKGKKGEVIEVIRKEGKDARVIVAGLNIVKKHTKPSAANPQGGIVEKEASVHISNVMLIDKNGKPTKTGVKVDGDKKLRVAKSTGETL
ncbi:50S ribosomal protein L24 [Kaistella palustris]|uniref:50S ribosomal protein L24 n=1 Tax=Kaistella palustris TaxID=493376 RepID=UPI00040E4285|nr:50S ribosomal protein L24 [Kaistella palustris]